MRDDEPRDTGTSRRALLAGLGTAGGVAISGCLTTLPSFGQRVRFGDVAAPSPKEPTYREWIPAEIDAYRTFGGPRFEYQVPGSRGETAIGAPYNDRWNKDIMDYVGIDYRSFESLITVGRVVVGRADFDRGRVDETLVRTQYEPTGAYEGFDLYRRTPPGTADDAGGRRGRTVAVGTDRILFARAGPEAIEELLDTGMGRRRRRHEADDAFGRMLEELGAHPVTLSSGGGPTMGGESADSSGQGVAFDDTDAYVTWVFAFPDRTDISRTDAEEWVAETPNALDATRVDLRIDGRVVSVVAKFDHGTFADLFGPLFEYPYITWGIDHDDADETLSFVHEAGDTVDASLFSLVDRRGSKTETVRTLDSRETLGPGDTVSVDISDTGEWSFSLRGRIPDDGDEWTEVGFNHTRVA